MTNENLDTQLSKLRIDKDRKHLRQRTRRWPKWVAFLLIIAGGGAGIYFKSHAPIAVKATRIEQQISEPGKGIPLVTASGYVVPRHKVEVSSKIVGRVKEVNIVRGMSVKEGDILLTIEDDDFQARVRSAEAQQAMIQARLTELRAGSRPQEVAAANAAVASSAATRTNAQLEMQRLEALARKGAVSKQDADRARTAFDVATARWDADRKNAELVKIGARKEVIEAAEAQLREAQANLELARTELDYTVIRAPITGTILEKLADQGELVTNTNFGGTRGAKSSVVTMADLSDLQIEVDLNESELSKVKLGQKTEIRLDANPKMIYTGEVDEISPQADRQKGTVQVKVKFLDPDKSVMTELNARVTFLGEIVPTEATTPGQPQLWIPAAAIVRDNGNSRVYLVTEGKAVAKPVTLGTESEKGIEVLKGLMGTEMIITNPSEKLTDGARVVVTP